MSNSNLKCSATNCAHNNCGNCYAGGINVAGQSATTTAQTCCSSFEDRSNAAFTNCTSCSDHCTCTSDIHCDATNCKYNQNSCCTSNNVNINAATASCETFCCE